MALRGAKQGILLRVVDPIVFSAVMRLLPFRHLVQPRECIRIFAHK